MFLVPGLRLCLLVAICGITSYGSFVVLTAEEDPLRPLDLPVAHAVTGIDFFGACVEGDAFVWCLDRSCSMGWSGEMGVLKQEVIDALGQLSSQQEFSLLAYSSTTVVFAQTLLEATPANIDSATLWVESISPSGSTCLFDALVTAIGIAETSLGDASILLGGDGAPSCGGTSLPLDLFLDDLAAANPTEIPVHTFYVSTSPAGIPYFLGIAAETGGIFVDTTAPADLFRRGDVNSDGAVDLSDAVFLLAAGFIPGSPQPVCPDAADVDDNGEVEFLTDAILVLQGLFVPGSPQPPAPGTLTCGADPTPDALLCSGLCP